MVLVVVAYHCRDEAARSTAFRGATSWWWRQLFNIAFDVQMTSTNVRASKHKPTVGEYCSQFCI